MFVMMADFELLDGAEEGFLQWFAESNEALAGAEGLVSRRLMRSPAGGFRVVVEHKTRQTLEAMIQSPAHERVHPAGRSFMRDEPVRRLYEVVAP
ncbi:MAG: antibiotic biosynthesis monooxygenase [Nitrosopumilus sp.]|nr:antibiotic biosynthesis monooxygenase [Nitrosopumilus sp.]MDA7943377.1 antibiotic biosynthesis monooxygenase [Nitrosopumilus sp.]MDA7998799.1 antibiotic biosynthesis monooxygenase [Nitrosopumilus sp.]